MTQTFGGVLTATDRLWELKKTEKNKIAKTNIKKKVNENDIRISDTIKTKLKLQKASKLCWMKIVHD